MPLAMFGPDDYPGIMGKVAMPALLSAAPVIGVLLDAFGGERVLVTLTVILGVPIICVMALSRLRRVRHSNRTTPLSKCGGAQT